MSVQSLLSDLVSSDYYPPVGQCICREYPTGLAATGDTACQSGNGTA